MSCFIPISLDSSLPDKTTEICRAISIASSFEPFEPMELPIIEDIMFIIAKAPSLTTNTQETIQTCLLLLADKSQYITEEAFSKNCTSFINTICALPLYSISDIDLKTGLRYICSTHLGDINTFVGVPEI